MADQGLPATKVAFAGDKGLEQVTICSHMNYPEGTVLTRFTLRVIIIREVLR